MGGAPSWRVITRTFTLNLGPGPYATCLHISCDPGMQAEGVFHRPLESQEMKPHILYDSCANICTMGASD